MPALNPGLRGPFATPFRQAFAPGAQSIIQRAISVLRRFGTNAHIYLPGVGMMSGLTAANYLDSAGTTVGTVDQPVGLVLDAAGGLGVELSPGTSTTVGWSAINATLASSGGSVIATATITGGSAVQAYFDVATVIGATYKVSEGVVGYTASAMTALVLRASTTAFSVISQDTLAGPELGELHFVATATITRILVRLDATFVSGVSTLTLNASSVREVTGIAASQPTTASKPILRRGAVNLLTNSGDFSNAAWAKTSSSVTTGALYIDGTTASKIQEDATNNPHNLRVALKTATSAASPITVAWVVKAEERSFAALQINMYASGDVLTDASWMPINLTAGVALSPVLLAGASLTSPLVSSVALGGGWVLACLSFSSKATDVKAEAYIGPALDATTRSYAGTLNSGVSSYRAALFQGTYTAAQIQALGGIPLTSTAPASTALGPTYWAFDGSNDSLSLGGPLFQPGDDFYCGIAATYGGTGSANKTLIEPCGTSGTAAGRVGQIGIDSGTSKLHGQWVTDALTVVSLKDSVVVSAGVPFVVSVSSSAGSIEFRKDAVVTATGTAPSGTTTITGGTIGARGTLAGECFGGNTNFGVVVKGLVSTSEKMLLDKLLANFQGRSI